LKRDRIHPLVVPVTASWFTKLSNRRYTRIGISRGPPRGQRGYRMYHELAPGPWFRSVDPDEFRGRYMAQLAQLDPESVLRDLGALAQGKVPALLCFEKPPPDPAWCHRALVSAWVYDTAALELVEVDHEHHGGGWSHPKLPPAWRKPK
jgi:uncharacterized protein DUF488